MKKTIFSIMFAMMMSIIVCSCTGNSTATVAAADSTAVDSIEVVDSTATIAVDSVSVDTVCVD